ncbi:hypothetical protein [Chitinimonas sp. JJ19]|uniref:hypothetical protein n=1 Tax=Chitinimonas sp. JJ19 TaxID=3109352 RepID=UPI003002F033
MFDVFDLILPNLKQVAGFELRQYQTAFGPDDRQYLYVGELQFAQVPTELDRTRINDLYAVFAAGQVKLEMWECVDVLAPPCLARPRYAVST